MIETLFMVNSSSNLIPKDSTRCPVLPLLNQENRVLDPKKSQNIAILLRALNVTIEEVCEALLEGNSCPLFTNCGTLRLSIYKSSCYTLIFSLQ